jgi:hypothetical protein
VKGCQYCKTKIGCEALHHLFTHDFRLVFGPIYRFGAVTSQYQYYILFLLPFISEKRIYRTETAEGSHPVFPLAR